LTVCFLQLRALSPWKLMPLDVAVQQSIEEMARALHGLPLDLLINNAGVGGLFNLSQTTPEDCVRQFQVNALGPLLVTRALLPNLRLAVSVRGSAFVAQVTSRIGSISDNSSGGAYAHRASKGALNVFTKSLAIDLEPQHIGCLLLHPGNVSTAYNDFSGAVEPEESVEGMARLIARAKVGDPLQLLHFGKGDVIDW
jgi:NAD(P)-dependent dehydrogenase (short-subunit alcohol dehydrogenase family)